MKKILVKEVSDEETNKNLEMEEKIFPIMKIEYLLYVLVTLMWIFLFSKIWWQDLESQRQDIIKHEEIKLEKVLVQEKDLVQRILKVKATKEQIKKCIELNSNTWSVTDCDLFFNK